MEEFCNLCVFHSNFAVQNIILKFKEYSDQFKLVGELSGFNMIRESMEDANRKKDLVK
jgi:hypothetical protein